MSDCSSPVLTDRLITQDYRQTPTFSMRVSDGIDNAFDTVPQLHTLTHCVVRIFHFLHMEFDSIKTHLRIDLTTYLTDVSLFEGMPQLCAPEFSIGKARPFSPCKVLLEAIAHTYGMQW